MTTKEEIIKEFEEKFGDVELGNGSYLVDAHYIQDWWLSKLSQQKCEIIEIVEGSKRQIPKTCENDGTDKSFDFVMLCIRDKSYNQALNDLIEKLK